MEENPTDGSGRLGASLILQEEGVLESNDPFLSSSDVTAEPCPNCGSTAWEEDDEGVSCSKCHHPFGEPIGDVDEQRMQIQRQKTVKTIEALMRAFDDLQRMKTRREHKQVIDTCKSLLKTAQEWK